MDPAGDLLADLDRRGLIHTTTDREALAARLATGPVTLYHGMDPSRDSLHTGNLVGLLVLRRFQAAGHHPIALAGGATGMIGDPSGRSDERNLLDEETLRHNVAGIRRQIERILGPEGGWTAVDNYDWTRDVRLLDFLRDVGKHATVNQMIARESVRARMEGEQGISFTEFSYMLLQAFDYWWLHEHHGCDLQIGGSDQWGNIVAGVDLVRRKSGVAVHALSWPLLTAPDGSKLGKTTGASVWLDAEKTSPYQFFQHFMHVDDRQIHQHLCWFTLLAVDEIDEIVGSHEAAPGNRSAQRRLATEVTTLVHGPDAAADAAAASLVLFGGAPEDADVDAFAVIAAEVPTTAVDPAALDGGADPVELLLAAGLAPSKSDARRLLQQGGASANGRRLSADARVDTGMLLHGRYLLLRRGRDRYALLVTQERAGGG
jgi:tyrosyl-tRNA synthetase